MNIAINPKAPVVECQSIIIQTPASRVWEVLTSIDNWAQWQTSVTESQLHGPVQQGTSFSWTAAGIRFESSIHTSIENSAFGWTGKTTGVRAIHNWSFEEKEGTSTVRVEESLQGFLPRLLRGSFRKSLRRGMEIQLHELKKACESET
ncbi:MAG: SRPBCC family protein [Chitinivibrionales bacterium]